MNINNQETPDIDDGKYIKLGLGVLVFVFGILGVWASYAKMDSGVPLPGQVIVESNNKIIQHLEGGIVKSIHVKDGDFVKKGDTLIKFKETRALAYLGSLEANFYESIALADRLNAENDKEKIITFSQELYTLEEGERKKLFKSQTEIFENRKSSYLKERKISAQKTASLNEQIENIKETVETRNSLLTSYKEEAKEQQELYNEGLIDKIKLREVNRKIESIRSEILSNKTDISRAFIQISEIETQLALSHETFFEKVKHQQRETKIAIADMKAKMVEAKDRLTRTSLKAPVNGTVLGLQIHTIGAVVSPAKPIMEIVPKNSKLIIKAMLSPEHRDYVKIGLKANMTFPAFQQKGKFINNIEGEVIFVAADSTTDQNGISYYNIKLKVDEEGKNTLSEDDLVLQAGMPAGVVIKIGKQTTMEYLLRPMAQMLNKAFLEE